MRVFACHLLNDYSGSPKVLMQLIRGWKNSGCQVHVVVSSGNTGFLSGIENVDYLSYWYRWSANPLIRLFNYVFSQLLLMFKLLLTLRRSDVVYVNTVLPFGAALAGWARRCRVIYHIHETSMKPVLLKKFLFGMVSLTASDVVYVSAFLARQEPVKGIEQHVLYNAIEDDFLAKSRKENDEEKKGRKNVLMVCSLKAYKGVFEFSALAALHPQYDFILIVNDTAENINSFFTGTQLTSNLKVFPAQTNLHPFYKKSDVLLNLSRPDEWVETFGLTVIEAMAYGVPAIVPPVGGIAELVDNGKNGYKVNSRHTPELSFSLTNLLENGLLYEQMKAECRMRIKRFSEKNFLAGSLKILDRTGAC
jgi:L-malate glycosyltransferase